MAPVKYLLISAGLLVSVMADYVAFSEWPTSLTAGQPVTLKWVGGSDAPATITLRKGASTDLQDVQVLSSDATNGEFNWTPPADLQNADDYAFEIIQGDEINYTGLVPLSGGSDVPNADELDGTRTDAENMSNSASATDTAAMTGVTDSAATAASAATETTGTGITSTPLSGTTTESAAAAVTDSAASTGSAASDAARTAAGTTASEGSSSTTSGPVSTETAKASKMNTPFVGSHLATSTATSSSSVPTGAADRVGVPPTFLAGAAGVLLLFM